MGQSLNQAADQRITLLSQPHQKSPTLPAPCLPAFTKQNKIMKDKKDEGDGSKKRDVRGVGERLDTTEVRSGRYSGNLGLV